MIVDSLQDPWAEIRRLRNDIRALQTASPLENSSVQRGSLRVLTEVGGPLAAVGHFEGKSGLVVPRAGTWLTLQEYVEAELVEERILFEGRLGQVQDGVDGLDGRMGAAENGIDGLNGRMGQAEDGIDGLDGAVGHLQGRMSAAEAVAATTTTNVTNVTNRVTVVEGKTGTNETQISHILGELTAVKDVNTSQGTKIGTLETDVAGVKSVNTSQGTKIGNLEGEVSNAKSRLTGVETRVTNLEGQVEDSDTQIGHVLGELSVVKTGLADVPSKIAASHEYPTARIKANEDWRNAAGPQITAAQDRADHAFDVAYTANTEAFKANSAAAGAKGRADSAYDLAYNAHGDAASAHGRANSAYDLAYDSWVHTNTRASQTALNTLQGQVGTLSASLATLRNAYNAHMDNYHGGGGKVGG